MKCAGAQTKFYYSYWDRGEELPLYYEGTAKTVNLSHRVEPQYLAPARPRSRGT